MEEKQIEELINRYISVSFSVTKKGENMIKDSIGDYITNDQHYTLRYIHLVGTCTSTELSEAFEVKKSAITAIINRLTEKELIKRTRDENDRRVIYLTLTEKGNDLYLKTEDKIKKLVESIITSFEESEIVSFIETYEKLNTLLDQRKDCKMEE
ncbi:MULTISPECIES: MarR family winged helix-turn-helix transcriptional regulator [Metabacillus]|uniref:MarR family transcriptional regulator n=3 Tax=Metabacillus TaxID=2675233 RepID=A0A179T3H0_9BACI|nr:MULTISPECIES: MarR family transcriptional regulator [Metabacillus]OAS87083.1 MarR family transcriptional regulator [Metabacillus litoralis]QNF26830.1 MarR family transcriptional regulator [Metabacillus sp. KUDC1714]